MKRRFLLKTIAVIVLCNTMISCEGQDEIQPPELPDTNLLGDFWFGAYQEDPLTNPEDPVPGFLYMKIPESGSFDGELYFSFDGCTSGVDKGRASGTVADGNLDGSWSGNVDGRSVGGTYAGQLVNAERYEGTYTNAGGKLEIVCNEDDSIFVAPNGTWNLQKLGNNEALNIMVDTSVDPISVIWETTSNEVLFYNIVFTDAVCLEQNLDLELCLMWSAFSANNSFVYGESLIDNVPAKPLIPGQSYLAAITCINQEGEATASSNIIFVR